jgi:hypothetical protein
VSGYVRLAEHLGKAVQGTSHLKKTQVESDNKVSHNIRYGVIDTMHRTAQRH